MCSIPIQPATQEDYPAIRALLQSTQLPAEDVTRESRHAFLVGREAGEIIGTIGPEQYPPYGLLRSLAVRADARGMGYGTALVNRLESVATAREIETLYLLTTTAEAFFRSRGYHGMHRDHVPPSIRQTTEFATLCPGTATCMRKELPPS